MMSGGTGHPSANGSHTCNVCNVTLSSFMSYQIHCSGYLHSSNLAAKNVSQKTKGATNYQDAKRNDNHASGEGKRLDMFDPFISEDEVKTYLKNKKKVQGNMRQQQGNQGRKRNSGQGHPGQHHVEKGIPTVMGGMASKAKQVLTSSSQASSTSPATSGAQGWGSSYNSGNSRRDGYGTSTARPEPVIDLTTDNASFLGDLRDYQQMRDQQSVLQSQLAMLQAAKEKTQGPGRQAAKGTGNPLDSAIKNTLAAMNPGQNQPKGGAFMKNTAAPAAKLNPNQLPTTPKVGTSLTAGKPLIVNDLQFYYNNSLKAEDVMLERPLPVDECRTRPFSLEIGMGLCTICPGKTNIIHRAVDWFCHVEGKKHDQAIQSLLNTEAMPDVKKKHGISAIPQKYLSQTENYQLVQDVFLHYDKLFPAQMQKAIKGKYCAFLITSGQNFSFECKLCQFRGRHMAHWIFHILSSNHAKACITALMKMGLRKFLEEYKDLPGPNPQNFWPLTKQFPLCLLPGIQGSGTLQADAYNWKGFVHMDMADPKNNIMSRLKDGKLRPQSYQSASASQSTATSQGKTTPAGLPSQGQQTQASNGMNRPAGPKPTPLMSIGLNQQVPGISARPTPRMAGMSGPVAAQLSQAQQLIAAKGANASSMQTNMGTRGPVPSASTSYLGNMGARGAAPSASTSYQGNMGARGPAPASSSAQQDIVALVQQKVQAEVLNSVQQNTVLLKAFLGALVQKITNDGKEKQDDPTDLSKKVVLDYSHGQKTEVKDKEPPTNVPGDHIASEDMEISGDEAEDNSVEKASSALLASAPWKNQSTARRDGQSIHQDAQSKRHDDQHRRHDDQHRRHDDQHMLQEDQRRQHEDQRKKHEDQRRQHDDQHRQHEDQRRQHEDQRRQQDEKRRRHDAQTREPDAQTRQHHEESNYPPASLTDDAKKTGSSLIKWTYKKWNKNATGDVKFEEMKPEVPNSKDMSKNANQSTVSSSTLQTGASIPTIGTSQKNPAFTSVSTAYAPPSTGAQYPMHVQAMQGNPGVVAHQGPVMYQSQVAHNVPHVQAAPVMYMQPQVMAAAVPVGVQHGYQAHNVQAWRAGMRAPAVTPNLTQGPVMPPRHVQPRTVVPNAMPGMRMPTGQTVQPQPLPGYPYAASHSMTQPLQQPMMQAAPQASGTASVTKMPMQQFDNQQAQPDARNQHRPAAVGGTGMTSSTGDIQKLSTSVLPPAPWQKSQGRNATQEKTQEVQKAFALVDQERSRADHEDKQRHKGREPDSRRTSEERQRHKERERNSYRTDDAGRRRSRFDDDRKDGERKDRSKSRDRSRRSYDDDRKRRYSSQERTYRKDDSRTRSRSKERSRRDRFGDRDRNERSEARSRGRSQEDLSYDRSDTVKRGDVDERYEDENAERRAGKDRDDRGHYSDVDYRSHSGDRGHRDEDDRRRHLGTQEMMWDEDSAVPERDRSRNERRREDYDRKSRRDRHGLADEDYSENTSRDRHSQDDERHSGRNLDSDERKWSERDGGRGSHRRGRHDRDDSPGRRRFREEDRYEEERLGEKRWRHEDDIDHIGDDTDGRMHRKRRLEKDEDLYGKRRHEDHLAERHPSERRHKGDADYRRHAEAGEPLADFTEHEMQMRLQQLILSLGIRDESIAAPLMALASQMDPASLQQLLNPDFLTAVGQLRQVLEDGSDPEMLGTLLNSDVMKDEGIYQLLQMLGLDVAALRVLHSKSQRQLEDEYHNSDNQRLDPESDRQRDRRRRR